MSINDVGKEGERLARIILKNYFCVDDIFQADWIISKNNEWYVIEVKHKARFTAPPFDGHGLNAYQADMRLRFYKEKGIRCLLLVIDSETDEIFWGWLDVLEQGEKFTTKNGIRIYPITSYKTYKHKAPKEGAFSMP